MRGLVQAQVSGEEAWAETVTYTTVGRTFPDAGLRRLKRG